MIWERVRRKSGCALSCYILRGTLLKGCLGNIRVKFWVFLMMMMMLPALLFPTLAHLTHARTPPPHLAQPTGSTGAAVRDSGGWPWPRGTQRCASPSWDRTACHLFFSLSLSHSLSLTLILCMCVSLSLPPLLLSPTNLPSLGRLEPTSGSKRSEEEKLEKTGAVWQESGKQGGGCLE